MEVLAGRAKCGFGDGIGAAAQLHAPCGLCVTRDGSSIALCDLHNHCVRWIDTASRRVTTIAGDGEEQNVDGFGREASIHYPCAMAWDVMSGPDSVLFIASYRALRRLNLITGARLCTRRSRAPDGAACA